MFVSRRTALASVAAATSLMLSGASTAQAPYPSKSVTLIVPAAAGGPTDTVARLMAEAIGRSLGQTIVVENRAGASGVIGLEHVAKAPPDGLTIGVVAALSGGGHDPQARANGTGRATAAASGARTADGRSAGTTAASGAGAADGVAAAAPTKTPGRDGRPPDSPGGGADEPPEIVIDDGTNADADAGAGAPPVPAGPVVHVRVTSEPDDATVVLGGVRLGRTPLDVTVPATGDEQVLKLRKRGYNTVKTTVRVDRDVTWDVQLRRRR